jgi:NADH-quinone oxidoreductase subunit H
MQQVLATLNALPDWLVILVGPWGLMQPAADAAKLILKEDLTPKSADPLVYRLAPFISLLTAFSVYAVIPFGASSAGTWAIGNVNAGILFVMAIASIGVYGISLGGWASGSKYPLLGSVRGTTSCPCRSRSSAC